MSNEVWYRKWRPQRFGDVAGQDPITHTLANAVASGRVAHAYLFCGPRGTGKTSTARILAKAVNCEQNEAGEPCNRCLSCRGMAEGRALDLIEMDAASNRGIDEIRGLREKVGYAPTSSAYKVYLIDEVHELTQNAFDALLKTLEEPPPHVIFVLATTEAERVPATIVSRCQRYDFRRIRVEAIVRRLEEICRQEAVKTTPAALDLIARQATGSLRDAINLLEQVVASHGAGASLDEIRDALGLRGEERARAILHHVLDGELALVFEGIAAARDDGIDLQRLQRSLLQYLRNVLLVAAGAESTLEIGDEALASLRAEAALVEPSRLLRILRLLASVDFRSDPLSPLPLELAFAELMLLPELAAHRQQEPSQTLPQRNDERVRAPEPQRTQQGRSNPSEMAAHRLQEALESGSKIVSARELNSSPRGLEAPARKLSPLEPVRPVDTPQATPPVDGELRGAPSSPEVLQVVASGDGPATLENLQALMGTVYDRLSAQRLTITSALINSGCNIIEVDEETVTLGFQHEIHAAKFRSEENGKHLREVETVLGSLSGRSYRLDVAVQPDLRPWRRAATGRSSHLLDEAEKLGLRRIEQSRPA